MSDATSRSFFMDVDGPLHIVERTARPGLPTLVCLHGLGSSAVTWGRLSQALSRRHRVLSVDLPGHGRSPLAGRSVGVQGSTALISRVLDEVGPSVLVGHSMGAALALLQAQVRPAGVEALVLLAPPMPRMPWEPMSAALASRVALYAWPWLGRTALEARTRRLGAQEVVRRGLALTCASADAVDEVTRQMLIQRVESGCVADHATFVEAARSVGLLVARARQYKRSIAMLDVPGLVVQGAADRLMSAGGLQQLAALQPDWAQTVLPSVGHSPHLEAPEEVARLVLSFSRLPAHALDTPTIGHGRRLAVSQGYAVENQTA